LGSLIVEVAHSIIAPAAKRRFFFFAPNIPFQRYLGCYQEAFETGVVLGYAFRNRLTTFAKLFGEPGHEQEVVTEMQELAQQRLTEVGEAKDFFDLGMCAEEGRMKAYWQERGIYEANIEFAAKHYKVPLKLAVWNLCSAVSVGIGMGSAFPELTEKLWKAEHEHPLGRDKWAKQRADPRYRGERTFGALTPEQVQEFQRDKPPESVTLAKRQEQLLSQVELFVSKTRPELLPQFRM